GSMTTIYNEEQTDAAAIIKSVEDAGYGASVRGETVQAKSTLADKGQDEVRTMHRRIQISFVFLALLMYLSMGSMLGLPVPAFFVGTQNAVTFAFTQFLLTLPIVIVNQKYYRN